MAQYDIAAATRRVSPVQEMMQYGLQQDARKINALNIEKAEIQMPYVEELTKQQVRRGEIGIKQGELAIEEAETRMPYLESQLDQAKRLTEVQIKQAGETLLTSQNARLFSEALKSGQFSPEELRKSFPMEWGQYRLNELRTMITEAASLDTAMNRVLGYPEDQQERYYNEEVKRHNAQKTMPPYQALGPQGLKELVRRTQGVRNTAQLQLLDEYKYYKDMGTEQGDHMAGMIERMLERQIMGNPTQYEALAYANWPGDPNPVAKQQRLESVDKDYRNAFTARMRNEFSKRTGQEMMMLDAFEMTTLAQKELGSLEYEQAMDNIIFQTEDWMRSQYGDTWQWYKHHRARLDGKPENERPLLPENVPKTPTPLLPADMQNKAAEQPEQKPAQRETGYQQSFTADNPARPTTKAEYDALKKGDYFINPKDGALKVKE